MNDALVDYGHGEPDLAARLELLRSPDTHRELPGDGEAVQVLETHMSWVFLAGDHVLKLKKAVRYPYLDFSTLDSRAWHCREELRLNARLAPGVYLGLRALCWDGRRLWLVSESEAPAGARIVDWLVLMRRLPASRMLDRLVAEGRVRPEEIDRLAERLVGFYRRATPVAVTPRDYRRRFERELAATREVLLRPQFRLPEAVPALAGLERALDRHGELLGARALQGRIVDGHGDLRPEHVCLEEPPVVIDALEFNAALRQVDPFDELAFLGLECAIVGADWIGPRLVDACARALGDTPQPALLSLFTAARALLRARLALAHLLDPQPRAPAKWEPQARRYLQAGLQALAALDHAD